MFYFRQPRVQRPLPAMLFQCIVIVSNVRSRVPGYVSPERLEVVVVEGLFRGKAAGGIEHQ